MGSQIRWYPFFSHPALGPIQGHKGHNYFISNLGQIEIIFSVSALTPSGKPLERLISSFAPIGMLDLSSPLALTPSVKVGLRLKGTIESLY